MGPPPRNDDFQITKEKQRNLIWRYMTRNDLIKYPKVVRNKIPNFKGAKEAAERLSELPEFKNAKVISTNLDKPQEFVRKVALAAGKEILVPIPKLKTGMFVHVVPPAEATPEEIKTLSIRKGILKQGTPVEINANIKVDLVVLGAVAVDYEGRRIGKGEGFSDLEFAILMKMGAITSDTIVVTTVHDCQVNETFPETMFQKHDVPVDIIVTPTKTIIISNKLKKPEGIYWDILTERRVNSINILQQMKEIDEKAGKEVVLMEFDQKDEARQKRFEKNLSRTRKSKEKNLKLKGEKENENASQEIKKEVSSKPSVGEKRQSRPRKIKDENSPSSPSNENDEKVQKRVKNKKYRSKSRFDFSLKVSNIHPAVRIRDLKNALTERGVRPMDITWRGQHGFCFLHFGKLRGKDAEQNEPVGVDSIVANLQKLRIGPEIENAEGEFVIVQPAKPITRIEVIEATAV